MGSGTEPLRPRPPVLTILLIVACIAVFALSNGGNDTRALLPLLFADPYTPGAGGILQGQIWRLVTPIFIHFGVSHIAFNMIWLWELGRVIELRKGALFLGVFVTTGAALSNLAQYVCGGSPIFGGMSGIVYALFGYIWLQGRLNPGFGYAINKPNVIIILGWFVLCWTGLLGPIANWAHTAGLAIGAGLGWIDGRKAATPV